MLRHLIFVVVLLGLVWGGMSLYNYLFRSRKTVDHRLAERTMKEIPFYPHLFDDHIVSFEAIGPGTFKLVTQGLDDGHEAGRLGYNILAVLDGVNIKLKSPRNVFKIYGYQDEKLIFEITYVTNSEPEIILHGPFEGIEYAPSFTKRMPGPRGVEVLTRISNA